MSPNPSDLTAGDVAPLLDAMRADDLDVMLAEGSWLGIVEHGQPVAVCRLFDKAGHWVLDDVWTSPAHRRRGLATALVHAALARRSPLWLICDEPDVAFYAARGFSVQSTLPGPLADHYLSKHEWPEAVDHAHIAMRAN